MADWSKTVEINLQYKPALGDKAGHNIRKELNNELKVACSKKRSAIEIGYHYESMYGKDL